MCQTRKFGAFGTGWEDSRTWRNGSFTARGRTPRRQTYAPSWRIVVVTRTTSVTDGRYHTRSLARSRQVAMLCDGRATMDPVPPCFLQTCNLGLCWRRRTTVFGFAPWNPSSKQAWWVSYLPTRLDFRWILWMDLQRDLGELAVWLLNFVCLFSWSCMVVILARLYLWSWGVFSSTGSQLNYKEMSQHNVITRNSCH